MRNSRHATRPLLVASLTLAALALVGAAWAQSYQPLRPITDEIEKLEAEYQAEGYLLQQDFHHNLIWVDANSRPVGPGDDAFTATFDAKPGRQYAIVVSAADGARDLSLAYDDSLGDHAMADTRNSDAALRPPSIFYFPKPQPATIRITARLVEGTRNYAVPTVILVFSRLEQ